MKRKTIRKALLMLISAALFSLVFIAPESIAQSAFGISTVSYLNVALNKPVIDWSSEVAQDPYWYAKYINNGTTEHGFVWASYPTTGNLTDADEWVVIDLGMEYILSELSIVNEQYDHIRNVKDYILYGSSTGAFSGEEFVIASGTVPHLGGGERWSLVFSKACTTRYVKFKAESSYSDNYVVVGELELFSPCLNVAANKPILDFSSIVEGDGGYWQPYSINDGSAEHGFSWASQSSGPENMDEWVVIDLQNVYTFHLI